jgi:hypothetical protein
MKEYTLETDQVYRYSLIFIIPSIIIIAAIYVIIWGYHFREINLYYDLLEDQSIYERIVKGAIIPFIIFNLGIILHEVIHAVLFAFFCKSGFRSIKIGVQRKNIIPYVHCKEKLLVSQYRITLLAPTIFLGLLPMLIAYINGNSIIWIYSYVFLIAGSGDILLFALSIKIPKGTLVMDHPQKLGFSIKE